MDEVITNLKVGKADYDHEERRPIRSNKGLARDTAFQLLYLILHAQCHGFENEAKDSAKLFNAVMFVVSHPGTFKPRAKRVIRLTYERFVVTTKQRAGLNKWKKEKATDSETDATTEEEFDDCFDSDDY
ncbi:hypothetical protein K402DRAFT_362716, partial [Aulographum hederae CBS 113979]